MTTSKKNKPRKRAAAKRPKSNGKKSAPRARVVDLGDVDDNGAADELLEAVADDSVIAAAVDGMTVATRLLEKETNGGGSPALPAELVPNETQQNATALAGGAIASGFGGAKAVAETLDGRDATIETLTVMLPADWAQDEDVQRMISTTDDAALVALLAVLSAQWKDGYKTAVNDHGIGSTPTATRRPFLLGPGPRDEPIEADPCPACHCPVGVPKRSAVHATG